MPKLTSMFFFLGAAAIGAAQPINAATAVVTSTSWVYYNGTYDWQTDYSFSATPSYRDTTGEPTNGTRDVEVQITSAWGGWAPVAKNYSFDARPYSKMTVSLKPTVANQKWQIYFTGAGGQALANNCTRNVTSYGPAPAVGKWATYTIPLSDLCVSGNGSILKFVVQDTTGLSDNRWFVNNVGFEAVGGGTVAAPTPVPQPTPTPKPVATPTPTAGTSWVYYNGSLVWPGDYSFSAYADYWDTSGNPLSGGYDTKISLSGPYGGWQPYAVNKNFNTAGYSKLTFALKPTQDNQQWNLYFVGIGDQALADYCTVNVLDYGPAPVVGKWATYTIPLSSLCVANSSIYKFAIHDETGSSYNVWYVDNVGFAP